MNKPLAQKIEFMDFEQPLLAIQRRLDELEEYAAAGRTDLPEKDLPAEIERLRAKQIKLTRVIYRQLSPMQRVKVARHAQRPKATDFVNHLITDFSPLAGDRAFGEDAAIIGGIGRFEGKPVVIVGTEKGNDSKTRVKHNFGMPKPDGYRKAIRLYELADRFELPVLTFIDTPGAYPGVDAEARGQGEAIARCIETLLGINVPVIATITGEGGSGGALALAVADQVQMLEHAVYSVISPEGCATILFGEANKRTIPVAAEQMKMTTPDLNGLGVIDRIIKEPVGGAHRDVALTMTRTKEALEAALLAVDNSGDYIKNRRQKFLTMTKK